MGVSTQSAMSLMADALDLRHRLPRLWALVEDLAVAPWKTRRVAADTRSLPFEAARWVDEQLAARVDGFGLPTIERMVALAAARFAPEKQAEKEEAHGAQHHVTLTHPRPGDFAGTSWLEAAGDTKDFTAFYALVCEVAKRLGRLGDTDDYETRKAKALGIIAGRQGALDLTGGPGDTVKPRKPVQTHLYVHVSLADLATHAAGTPVIGEVEKLGPATLDLIRTWLARLESQDPPGPRPQPHRRRRPARPTAVDARARDPPRPALHVPLVRPRRPDLRPRPHPHAVRRSRPAGSDQSTEPGAVVPATSSRQDSQAMALRTHRG